MAIDPETTERAVDDYRFSNRLPSRAEAVRRLIETGLRHVIQPPLPPARALPADDVIWKIAEQKLAAARGRKSAERLMKRVGARPHQE